MTGHETPHLDDDFKVCVCECSVCLDTDGWGMMICICPDCNVIVCESHRIPTA